VNARIAVIGAGPAGLSAAAVAARAGAVVDLLEERDEAGGQLRYRAQPVVAEFGQPAERPFELADRLLEEATVAGVQLRLGAVAAGCFVNGRELLIVENTRSWNWHGDALIVATGSTDLPYPFPGATYPGVFSGRGLQILLNRYRIRPGQRFAIIGGASDAEELAVDVMLAGGEVVWSGIAPAPFLRAEGVDGVNALRVGGEAFAVDVIAIAVGRQPDPALATMAGVPLAFAAELGGLVPVIDEWLQAPTGQIFVAGDAAGAGSIAAAIAEGRLAGAAAAARLGLMSDDALPAVRDSNAELAARAAIRSSLQPVFTQSYEGSEASWPTT
jgi:sarcosine oxidase subunit alpha